MKNDPSFKFVAAIIFIGVVLAFVSPTRAVNPAESTGHSDTAAPSGQTE